MNGRVTPPRWPGGAQPLSAGCAFCFDPPTCVAPLRKVHAALKPGGRAALEFVPNEDRVSPPMAASFNLTMLATTVSGDAYTFRDLETMYHNAGYGDVTAHPVPNGPHTVVMGRSV